MSTTYVTDRGAVRLPAGLSQELARWHVATTLGVSLGVWTSATGAKRTIVQDQAPDERAFLGLGPREVSYMDRRATR